VVGERVSPGEYEIKGGVSFQFPLVSCGMESSPSSNDNLGRWFIATRWTRPFPAGALVK